MAPTREKVIRAAEKYVARGKVESAIREYRKVLAENPRDASTLNRVGDLYARINRIDDAVALFSKIAEQYTEDGFFVKAIAIYKKIIKLDPTRLEVYERLADLYHRQGLVNEARTQYQVLADYYVKHDDDRGAQSIFRRMIELEPENLSHRARLADLYHRRDRVGEAMGEYRTIAQEMMASGRVEEASRVYEKALDVSAEDISFIAEAVLKLREAGHQAAAARLLSVAVERNPKAEQVARLARLTNEEGTASGVGPAPDAAVDPRLEPAAPPIDAGEEPVPVESAAVEEAPSAEAIRLEESTSDELFEDASAALGTTLEEEEAAPEIASEQAADESVLEAQPFELEEIDPVTAADPALTEEVAPAESTPVASETEEGEEDLEFDLDLDEVFVLDFEEEEVAPASLVDPPTDIENEVPAFELAEPAVEPKASQEPEPEASQELELEASQEPEPEVSEPLEPTASDEPEAPAAAAMEEAPAAALEGSRPGAIHIDAEMLERTAAEVQAELTPQLDEPQLPPEDDLVTEAEVLAKYGLLDRAQERLRHVLATNPRHLGALCARLQLHVDAGHQDRVVALAGEVFEVAAEQQADMEADRMARRLQRAGYTVEDGNVEPPSADDEVPASAVDELLSDALDTGAPPAATGEHHRKGRSLTAELDEIAASVFADPEEVLEDPPVTAEEQPAAAASSAEAEAAQPEPFAPSKPTETVPPGEVIVESWAEELQAEMGDELDIQPTIEQPAAQASAPEMELVPPPELPRGPSESERPVDLDDSMSWLDDASKGASASPAGLFAEEDDFFDLAGALEEELKAEEEQDSDGLLAEPAEQSLEEIVEGFKKGVAENLSEEDYETHFNLGIAYREMGLLDEAIGEFQLASKAPVHLVECCSMLGLCFLEKGLPELAVKWYQRGLEAPGLSEEENLGLQYDLGNAFAAQGESEEARKVFVEIYGTNSNYRDIVAKLEELAH